MSLLEKLRERLQTRGKGADKFGALFIDLTAWQSYRDEYAVRDMSMMLKAWPVEDGEPVLFFARENDEKYGEGEYEHNDLTWGLIPPGHDLIIKWQEREQYVGAIDVGELDFEGEGAEMFDSVKPAPTTPTLFYHDLNGGYLERLRPQDHHAGQALRDATTKLLWAVIILAATGAFIFIGGQS